MAQLYGFGSGSLILLKPGGQKKAWLWPEPPTSKMAHSQGCWQDALDPHHADFSIELLLTGQLTSPGTSDPKEKARGQPQ